MSEATGWDEVVDVVVVGSGSAALTAATLAADNGAQVAVMEKGAMLGGTTAVSGGVMWLPRNHHMAAAGIDDDRDDALAYLEAVTAGRSDPAMLSAFVDSAPEAIAYLEGHTPLQTTALALFPDYYFPYGFPGRRHGGRSVEPVPFAVGRELPDWRDRLVSRGTLMSLGSYTTLAEDLFGGGDEGLAAELARREAEDTRPKGAALIAALLKGLLVRGVDIRLASPVRELVHHGRAVTGVVAERDGRRRAVGARQGVVLACGGFEWNPDLVRSYVGYEVLPLSPPNNVGDGLLMAADAGAQLANLASYWGTPAMLDPAIHDEGGRLVPQFEGGRGTPASLVVNGHGLRFANEAVPYNDFPKAFGAFDPSTATFPNRAPAWLIFDRRTKDSTQILSIAPDRPAPPWVPQAAEVRDLAPAISVDPDTLAATVERYNQHAKEGEDPDFGRHRRGLMGPGSLKPLDRPPYYAVALYPGALGTNGGPLVTTDGQAVDRAGDAIPGLYAVGNTAANAFGWAYPSGGATIAHGVVFGFRAGRHVASQPRRPLER